MKDVMVYAYTQFNLGDDLFIKVLCERYPQTQFSIVAPSEYRHVFNGNDNIRFIRSDSIWNRGLNFLFRKLGMKIDISKLVAATCDAAVRIGGSLFMQGEDWKDEIEYTKRLQIPGKPFFLLGANFGPFYDREYVESYRDIFVDYTDICFREQYSYELFKDLNQARLADDIIFQMKGNDIQAKEQSIIISVIKPSYRESLLEYDEVYYQKMKDIAIGFIERGYQVTLMSFCEYEGDQEAVEEIVKMIPSEHINKVRKHYYKLNLNETLQLIASSSFVVATRFHAMILGWVYQKPVFPIAYSRKMTNLMKDVGFTGYYSDFQTIDQLDAMKVIESMETNWIDVSKQAKCAEQHFEKLDQFLKLD